MQSIWKGSLNFGLVNIPIKLYSASKEKELSFVLLHKKDLSKIRYAKFCQTEGVEVPWSEIVKGYEYKKDHFVILESSDFDKAHLQRMKSIEILNFIKEEEIESFYYVKPYFLEPDKNAEHAYRLLREALKQSGKVGLAKYVLRNREHLAVIKVHGDMIFLNELRYRSEILNSQDLKIPAEKKPLDKKEVHVALQLIDYLTTPFKPEIYKDEFAEEMKRVIQKKSKGRPIHPKMEKATASSPKVQDIMSLLKASLEKKKTPRGKSYKTA